MELILENTHISNCNVSKEPMNFLRCNSMDEVVFDIFEVKTDSFECLKERKSTWNDRPVIHLDLKLDGKTYKDVPFALIKEGKTSINPSLLDPSKEFITEEDYKKTYKPNISDNVLTEGVLVNKEPEPEPKELKDQVIEYIQKEATDGFIANLVQDKFYSLLADTNDSKVVKFFNTYTEGFKKSFIEISEKIARREGLRAMESGGGSNAVQYANGGRMVGTLDVTNSLSAHDIYQNGVKVGTVNKKAFLIGDGVNQVYNVTHNFHTFDCVISVYDAFTNELVYPAGRPIDSDTIEISFNGVIASNSYKVIVMA